jgi:hypothetical protein
VPSPALPDGGILADAPEADAKSLSIISENNEHFVIEWPEFDAAGETANNRRIAIEASEVPSSTTSTTNWTKGKRSCGELRLI